MATMLTVVGARPQFIKAGPVSGALRAMGSHEVLVHTGQHFDPLMSKIFFDELGVPRPAYNLDVNSLGHGAMTGRMLEKLEAIMVAEKPDAVLVYGDTNSTLAGALAAAKLDVPVAHVEAGLRSFDRRMPEGGNRVVADHVSRWLFAPTPTAAANPENEGIREGGPLGGGRRQPREGGDPGGRPAGGRPDAGPRRGGQRGGPRRRRAPGGGAGGRDGPLSVRDGPPRGEPAPDRHDRVAPAPRRGRVARS